MADDPDREQYDRAADRHPTTIRVDPDLLARAERLFGPDPAGLAGYWDGYHFVAWRKERPR
jgi:hypothetical protein